MRSWEHEGQTWAECRTSEVHIDHPFTPKVYEVWHPALGNDFCFVLLDKTVSDYLLGLKCVDPYITLRKIDALSWIVRNGKCICKGPN